MNNEDLYWYWLCNIPRLGRKLIGKLLEEYGTPKVIFYENDNDIYNFVKMNNGRLHLEDYSSSKNEESIIYSYERLKSLGVSFIHPCHKDYPDRLKNIPDAPYGLYVKGSLPDNESKSVAIIGSRNSTHYGREMGRVFGRELAKCGIVVVSGLARGIDGMAHRGAIEAGSYTLGILGCGIDVVYPQENYELFIEMEKTGGIISESNIGVKPDVRLFPQRNRLISGMADGILVIEAKEKSGTFITVDQGLEQGREIFALPGRILDENSRGCNNLIKMGAHLVTDVSDIIEILCGRSFDDKEVLEPVEMRNVQYVKNLLAPTEKMVYSVLSVEPKYIDDIITEIKLSPDEVCMHLNKLFMAGYIDEPARNYYSVRL